MHKHVNHLSKKGWKKQRENNKAWEILGLSTWVRNFVLVKKGLKEKQKLRQSGKGPKLLQDVFYGR